VQILFLDDNPERHKKFRTLSIGCSVDFVWNAAEAIEKLSDKENEYDLIMLDHDLDVEKQDMLLEDEEDGRYVARHLATLVDFRKNSHVVIHSLNYNGGLDMQDILTKAGFENVTHLPFGWRMFRKTDNGCEFVPDDKKWGSDVSL